MTRYFKLFSSCVPVDGASEGLLYDIERQRLIRLKKLVYQLLKANEGRPIEGLKRYFENQYDEGIDAYFNLFEQEELGFYTDEPSSFPPISMEWESPLRLRNAILEINSESTYSIEKTLKQLDQIGCEGIQLRFLDAYPLDKIQTYLIALNQSRIKGVELYIKFDRGLQNNALIKLLEKAERLVRIIVFSAPEEHHLDHRMTFYRNRIFFTKAELTKDTKEIIHPDTFVTSIEIFTEAQQHNLGLNRKISIDAKGQIKNYPSHQKSYGHINEFSLISVLNDPEFRAKWFIPNDEISKCKDCQFRFACISNSDLIFENDAYKKVDDCNYNPYLDQWSFDAADQVSNFSEPVKNKY